MIVILAKQGGEYGLLWSFASIKIQHMPKQRKIGRTRAQNVSIVSSNDKINALKYVCG